MSEQDQARALAERIARRLGSSGQESATRPVGGGETAAVSEDLTALRVGLAEIQRRLAHIESHIGHDEPCGPSLSRTGETAYSTPRRRRPPSANETRPPHLSEPTCRRLIRAGRSASTRLSRRSLTTSSARRLAASSRGENLATTARCAARADFRDLLHQK